MLRLSIEEYGMWRTVYMGTFERNLEIFNDIWMRRGEGHGQIDTGTI